MNMAPITRSHLLGPSRPHCDPIPGQRTGYGITKRHQSRGTTEKCSSRSAVSVAQELISRIHLAKKPSVEAKDQLPSPLLRLPAELRNMIYYYALTEEEPMSYKDPLGLAILRTNHQIYNEASHIYHESNTFIIGDDRSDDENWLQRIIREPRQRIKFIYAGDSIFGLLPMFELLSQCSNLSLTMELPMSILWRLFGAGYLNKLHGFSNITCTRLCKGKRTPIQVDWWNLWQSDLQKVLDHFGSSCPDPYAFHANKSKLNNKSVVRLYLTHCCSTAHCCTLVDYP